MATYPAWSEVRGRIKASDENVERIERRVDEVTEQIARVEQATGLMLSKHEQLLEGAASHIERIDGEVSSLADRVAILEGDGAEVPVVNLARWLDPFEELEGPKHGEWVTLAQSYSHDARHIIGAYCDLVEAGIVGRTPALEFLVREFISAYYRYPRNRNDDLMKNMVLPRAYVVLGDEAIREHCARVLDDVRHVNVGNDNGVGVRYREFSHLQNRYPFSFSGPWGRWQGQGTAVWLLASLVDTTWADDMLRSWEHEMDQTPGLWGATWNENEEPNRHVRNTFKAGREVYLAPILGEGVFLNAWDRVRGLYPASDPIAHQYIDGTTSSNPQLGATQLYDGWVRLGQWSEDMREVTDWVLSQTGGPWHSLNDTDPARVRRAALLAGRARVEVLR